MKKTFSLLIIAAVLSLFIPAACKMREYDVWYGVDENKFTHEEWTGRDFTDKKGNDVDAENIFEINREPASVTAIPYQDSFSAASAVWDYNAREASEYMKLLTGKGEKWKLTVVKNQDEARKFLDGGFMNENYAENPADGWKEVELPKSWTMFGFDYPIYTNVTMPWQGEWVDAPEAPRKYNPVGLYRKTFTVPEKMREDGRRIYIQFDGVESAYYVYLNGKEVGYSEDSFSPHKFDITDYLSDGENLLAVEAHKFCDGTWFEDQDMIYDGGIFRDVFLISRPAVQISDYTVRTELDESCENALLKIEFDIKNLTTTDVANWKLRAEALDENGADILSGCETAVSASAQSVGTFTLEREVKNPRLWSAETPNIYALVLTLCDEKGEEVEILSSQLGFREIGFTKTEVDKKYRVITKEWQPITINGKRLIFKGVNRHDTDPFYGEAVPKETMLEDIRLMKQNNINAIRTSHYSNDSYLYWLCGKYGIYMMAETNLEAHALMGDDKCKALFYNLALDRTKTAFERLKNYPAIVAWSIGNEMVYTSDPDNSGGMFRDMVWYFKENDPTRPVHSESLGEALGVDMGSNMYPSSDSVWHRAGKGRMPYVMCEYDHAMGNSVGALKEYWDAIRSADNMLGGFIWDWADQARALDIPEGASWDYYAQDNAHKNLYADESPGKYFGYGGDFGDNPNDNSFCQNGLVTPDRVAQPELQEVKYQYQSFWFESAGEKKISVYNENGFKNLDEYEVSWQLLENGVVIGEGVLPKISVLPESTGEFEVPYVMPDEILEGCEFYLNLSVKTTADDGLIPKGSEVAYRQLEIPVSVKEGERRYAENVSITQSDAAYIVKGQDFEFFIDKSTGIMEDYTYKGERLITEGPRPNFRRGYVENDSNSASWRLFDKNWRTAADEITVGKIEADKKRIEVSLSFPKAEGVKEKITYTIGGGGEVTVGFDADATVSEMGDFLRIGSLTTLPEGFENVTWYGNGPRETYRDRKSGARQGIWREEVSDFFFPFMKVDDCGNLTDVKWISLKSDAHSSALLIAASEPIEASALHFTPKDLDKSDHVYKLSPRKETMLSLDYGSMGTGSATCGQGTLPQYTLKNDRAYSWEFTIIPVKSTASDEELTEIAAKYRTVPPTVKDGSGNGYVFPIPDTAQIKPGGENAMSGSMALDIPSAIFEGKNSFTIEVNVVPTGDPAFNMFLGKGDNAFALRTRPGSLDFHIHAGGAWRSIVYYMPDDMKKAWVGRKHHVAGVYDAEKNTISLFCDGKTLLTQEVGTDEGVTASEYDFTVGACPSTGRSSEADFYEVRVYKRALSEDELAAQNSDFPKILPSDECVALWLDFDDAENVSN